MFKRSKSRVKKKSAKSFLKAKPMPLIILFVLLATAITIISVFFNQPPQHTAVENAAAASPPRAPKICPADFKRNLELGMKGPDVKELQQYLNNNGFAVAKSSFGSKGKETTFFGLLTKQTLAKFQKAKNIRAAYGIFDEATRIYLGCLKVEPPVGELIGEAQVETNDIKHYAIGGKITGLTDVIVLQNNNEDDLAINPKGNSSFTFPTALTNGQAYVITIKTKPLNHNCYIYRGAGIVDGANVSNIDIACGTNLSYNPFIYNTPAGGGSTTYTLTYTAGTGGSLTGSASQTVNSGASGSAITAVANAHYSFVNWSDSSTANPRTDTNVIANKLVTANFTIDTYTITSSAGANGTISPLGATIKDYGSSQTYTITPDDSYSISDVFIDSQSVGTPSSYEFTDIQASHTISVIFSGGPQ